MIARGRIYATLPTGDMERSRRFYQGVLGLRELQRARRRAVCLWRRRGHFPNALRPDQGAALVVRRCPPPPPFDAAEQNCRLTGK
jgi:catechol 2,3-dioxygenase-like lactoylglutathione lyase family enzyme